VAESKDKLLVIEDDPGLQSQLKWSFEAFDVAVAEDRDTAIAHLRRFEPAVVTLDLGLPPDPGGVSVGFGLLEEILALAPDTKVIVVTGHNDRTNAMRAIAMGAYDFYEKPIDPDLLGITIQRAARLYHIEQENRRLQDSHGASALEGLIASSPQMMKVCRTIEKLAPTDVSTLILGESGTGKEVLVKALHNLSDRRDKRLVAINCAAIPEALLESELFGYEKGAFTGAVKTTPGKIEVANGGMLFLDEVGDLPHPLQAKLLRFLQERVIERIGGRNEIPVDVRVVCATHRNLPELIAAGDFREDLFYRLNVFPLTLPALRERPRDILPLARHLMARHLRQGESLPSFEPEAEARLLAHRWPGNVRELDNLMQRALILCDGERIHAVDIHFEALDGAAAPLPAGGPPLPDDDNTADRRLSDDLRNVEEQMILDALRSGQGSRKQAAQILGISPRTLRYKLQKLRESGVAVPG
jgi:two-component system NtrC family response regulator